MQEASPEGNEPEPETVTGEELSDARPEGPAEEGAVGEEGGEAPGGRRRRRRRRRKSGPAPASAEAADADEPPPADPDEGEEAELLPSDDAVVEVEHEPTAEEEDDDDADDLSNLDVPSWQEIVASLYRPER
jgi:hypothetical protein